MTGVQQVKPSYGDKLAHLIKVCTLRTMVPTAIVRSLLGSPPWAGHWQPSDTAATATVRCPTRAHAALPCIHSLTPRSAEERGDPKTCQHLYPVSGGRVTLALTRWQAVRRRA